MSKQKQRKAFVNGSVISLKLAGSKSEKVFFKEKGNLFIRFAEQGDIIVNKFAPNCLILLLAKNGNKNLN